MLDSFYHITESSELIKKKKKIRFQSLLIWSCRSAMFRTFCVGIHRCSALTFGVIKSYLTHMWDKTIRNGYITLETRVVM